MAITPVTPIDREKLVPTSTSIIIDFDGVPTLVDVNGSVVFDGSFQSGWSGSLLNKPGGGKRLVLDPPSAFVLGTLVSVLATENGNQVLGYIFETGTEKITADDKNSSPRVVETGFAQKAIPTPTWHQTFDGGGSPQVDEQGVYDMTVEGLGADFQQPGKINLAINLDGAAYLKTEAPLVPATVYQQDIEVTNTGAPLTGFQVQLTLDTATLISEGKMLPNSRVKFLDAGDNELDYWFQGPENNAASVYWVKVDLPTGTTTIRVEYSQGIDYSANEAGGDAVFELFDDFEDGTIDPAKWNVTGTGFSESGGNLVGGIANAGANYIRSIQTFNAPVIVTTQILETTPVTNGFTTIGFWNSTVDGVSILSHNTTSYYRNDGGWVNFGFNPVGAEVTDEVWMTGSQARVRRVKSGQTYDSGFFANTLDGETVFLGARHDFGSYGAQAYTAQWRYIHVRQYSADVSTVFGTVTINPNGPLVPPVPNPLLAQVFSLEGWFYVGGVGTERVLATSGRSADHGWELRITAANRLRMTVYDGAGGSHFQESTTTFSSAGVWAHMGVAVDAANEALEVTINGVKQATSPGSWGFTTIAYDTLVMEMGRNVIGDSEYWPGRLDQWRYYDGQFLDEVQFRVRYQEGELPDPKPYVAYVKDPGELYLRRDEPLTPEVKVVDGEIVDIGYDPKLDKFIVFFVNNDRVFVTSADPGDGPTSLTQPSALTTNMRLSGPSPGGSQSLTTEDFPPIKLALPLDSSPLSGGAGGQVGSWQGDFVAVTPSIINLEPSIIRMARPTQEASGSLAIGFIPLKFTAEVTAVRRLPFVPLPEGAGFADYEDPAPTPGARYACIVVYRRGAGQFEGPRGGGAERPTAADVAPLSGGNGGADHYLLTEDFPPLKLALPLDNIDTSGGSQGRSFSFFSTGFGDIGVGS